MKKTRQWPQVVFVLLLSLYLTIPVWANINVKLTSPQTGDVLAECVDIPITCDLVIESGEVKDVRYYRNGSYFSLNRKVPYDVTWKKPVKGYYELCAKATDKEGNIFSSDTIYVRVGNIENGDLILNGEFECQNYPWTLSAHEGAVASLTLEEDGWVSEGNQALIEIQEPGTADWHVQLAQNFGIYEGHTYDVSFGADAFTDKTISVEFQENKDPWTVYWIQTVEVTGLNTYGPYTFECNVEDPLAVLRFNIGGNTTSIYLDNVQVIDYMAEFLAVEDQPNTHRTATEFFLTQNYPNPFNSSTIIQYSLPEQAQVSVDIFNMLGQKISRLVEEEQVAGQYELRWNGTDDWSQIVPSGVYFYRLNAKTAKQIYTLKRKILYLK